MPWVLDGSNLAGGGDRGAVREAALALARRERISLVVYFDGTPPAGAPPVERLGPVEVRYVPDADAAIVKLVGSKPRSWIVASDDRALARRVRASGARAVAAAVFWKRAAGKGAERPQEGRGVVDVAAEAEYFRDATNRLPGDHDQRTRPRRGKGHQGRR